MFRIKISDNLLESMTLAAIEAYCLGDGRSKELTKLETLGYLWGFKKISEEETVFLLDRMSLSLSAKRDRNSVTPNHKAVEIKNSVVERWSPHLSLLGDFHTHPYENLQEVNSCKGFEFSEGDISFLLNDDFLWEKSDQTPINLAITICELGRVHSKWGGDWIRNNIWQYDIGEFRLWINANVGYLDDDGDRQHTGNKRSKTILDLNTRFFNEKGDRVGTSLT